jgi:hypothetical protein
MRNTSSFGLFDGKDCLHTFVLTKTLKEVSDKRKKLPDGMKARIFEKVKAWFALQGHDFRQIHRYSIPFREQ